MSLPGEHRWQDASDGDPDARPSVRGLAPNAERAEDEDSTGGMVAEVIWHGGGTRDAYEALLLALFAPEGEPR
ncbi:MAG: hypothetical protein M3422_25330 [Actinomycetota bacterium]|nr:hypothetical protein [Actinomycetota bacterium]